MTALLDVRELSCTMGGVRALDEVSLQVDEGAILGIVGPNGAGKTTLFNAITGFVPYQRGEVSWAGKALRRRKPHQIANAGLMRTFQNAGGLQDLTVRENLLVAARPERAGELDPVAELLRLTRDLDAHVRDCSLATRKLVGIAMAVIRTPRMILLDEPMAGLDAIDRDAVTQVIRLVHGRGVTVALIEHDVDRVLSLADRVVILDVGRAVAAGTPDELAGRAELRNVYLKA